MPTVPPTGSRLLSSRFSVAGKEVRRQRRAWDPDRAVSPIFSWEFGFVSWHLAPSLDCSTSLQAQPLTTTTEQPVLSPSPTPSCALHGAVSPRATIPTTPRAGDRFPE